MTAALPPVNDPLDTLDPSGSWVIEACAGSGKTWLLVSRIVRLLLEGAQPRSILGITFTRRAAREMRQRLDEWLWLLASAPEAEVAAFLTDRGLPAGRIPALLPRARRLYETVLGDPAGVRLDTFHAWFLDLIDASPLDSPYGGRSLSEATGALEAEAWRALMEEVGQIARAAGSASEAAVGEAAADAPGAVQAAAALARIWRRLKPATVREALFALLRQRAALCRLGAPAADAAEAAVEALQQAFPYAAGADPFGAWIQRDGARLRELAARLGDVDDKATAQRLAIEQALAEPADARGRSALQRVFLTREGEQRSMRSLFPKTRQRLFGAHGEAMANLFVELSEACHAASDAELHRDWLALHADLLPVAMRLVWHYEQAKTAARVIDFVDVEHRVVEALRDSERHAYLMARLDARYRHVLLDEFQDTSPLQWLALEAWFTAVNEAGTGLTVFLVGDPKQSIYRFRGAEPLLFGAACDWLQRNFQARMCRMDKTRRNPVRVVDLVNAIFASRDDFEGFESHTTANLATGAVHALPLFAPPSDGALVPATGAAHGDDAPAEASNGWVWRDLLTQPRSDAEASSRLREAREVARCIAAWLGSARVADGRGGDRPACHADVAILFRNRTHQAVFERALAEAGIPTMSDGGEGLLDTLEVSDLHALLRCLVDPLADLELAQVLRSPMFDASAAALTTLAQAARCSGSWWAGLTVLAASDSPAVTGADWALWLRRLSGWRELSQRLPAHDLLDRVFHEADLPAAYCRRLPAAMASTVRADLEAFLNLALDLDGGRQPGVAAFLARLHDLRTREADAAPAIARPLDSPDAVRLLTVHAAKGLEWPLVWLADAAAQGRADGPGVVVDWPPGSTAPRWLACRLSTQGPLRGPAVWRERLELGKRRAARESLNLLYVALTRSRQVFGVSGSVGRKSTGGHWYAEVEARVSTPPHDSLGEPGAPIVAAQLAPNASHGRPGKVLMPPLRPLPVLPQTVGERRASAVEVTDRQREGLLVHAVMQWLAPPAPPRSPEALAELLGVDSASLAGPLARARQWLARPHLSHLFDPARYEAAFNEFPLVDVDGKQRRIDRLVLTAGEAWVIDYKSGGLEGETLDVYRHQLLDYRRAVAAIWPGRVVHAGLVAGEGDWIAIDG